jgi:hypothetical protein
LHQFKVANSHESGAHLKLAAIVAAKENFNHIERDKQ